MSIKPERNGNRIWTDNENDTLTQRKRHFDCMKKPLSFGESGFLTYPSLHTRKTTANYPYGKGKADVQ